MVRAHDIFQGAGIFAVNRAIFVVVRQPLMGTDDEILGIPAIQPNQHGLGYAGGIELDRRTLMGAEGETERGSIKGSRVNRFGNGVGILQPVGCVDRLVISGMDLVESRSGLALAMSGGAVCLVQIHLTMDRRG